MNLDNLKNAINDVQAKLILTEANMLKYITAEWDALRKYGPNSTEHILAAQKLQAKKEWIEQAKTWLAEAQETVNNDGNLIFN